MLREGSGAGMAFFLGVAFTMSLMCMVCRPEVTAMGKCGGVGKYVYVCRRVGAYVRVRASV
jgi:hypothetical protein